MPQGSVNATPRWTLGEIFHDFPATLHGHDGVVATGVSMHSSKVHSGDVFVAVRGRYADGHDYIAEAAEKHAAAVVSELPPPAGVALPWVTVGDARAALGWLAAAFAGFPTRKLGLIGVTGTDGKTTTTHLIGAILAVAGFPVGLVSTVEFRLGDETRRNSTDNTTPPATVLQPLLAEMVERGLHWAVVEVTSHALHQGRLVGSFFDGAVFTNLTPEHLDYHGTPERYLAAKGRLFEMLGREAKEGFPTFGVINADDKSAATLREICKVEQLTYGIRDDGADYRVVDIRAEEAGTLMRLETPAGPCELWTPLIGEYSVYNIAAAATVTLRLGVPPETVSRALRGFRGVPGRLQRVDEGQAFQVVVDFAHTPNALRAVLTTLRPRTSGKLIVVFGHPGERDRQNRRDVAQTAAELADFLVLTYDDPYNEDPLAVLDQIEDAVRETGRRAPRDYQRFNARPDGIAAALGRAEPGDTVLIAGRGHLGYTVVRGQKSPLDDVDLARRELRRLRVSPGAG